MSTIKKLNKIPTVLQKIDPKMLELKKKNVELQIAVHKIRKQLEEEQKKAKKKQNIL